jgi:hypothetical protein
VLTPITIVAVYAIRPSENIGRWLFPGGRKVIPIPTIVAAFVVFWWATTAAHRGLRRERKWVAALPFTLTGWEDLLGDSPGDHRAKLMLAFRFDGEPPPPQMLVDLLSGDGGAWKVDGDVATREPGIDPGYKNYDHNRPLRKWFHRLVDQELLPLYQAHRFTALEITNDR